MLSLVMAYYPLFFMFVYFYAVYAFFEAARKYDNDFYCQLGRPHMFRNNTYETTDLFLRCMWFKRYFARDRRVVAKAKTVRTSFFVFLMVLITYPFVRGLIA
jgi:hypothetical protein